MRTPHAFLVVAGILVALSLSGCSKEPTEDELLKSATKYYSEDDFDKAIDDYKLLVARFPKSDNVPEALYAMGVIYANKKKEFAKAESVYTILAMNHPGHATAPSAAYQRARIFAQELKKPDSAVVAYEYFLKQYPKAGASAAAQTELSELRKPQKPTKQ